MWFRLKALFAHSRTIFVARMYMLFGVVVGIHDSVAMWIGGQDFTPLTTRALDATHIPMELRPLTISAAAAATGAAIETLRKVTTQSLGANKADAIVAAEAAGAGIPSPPAPSQEIKP